MRDSVHYVQFFDNDLGFVQATSAFLQEGLDAGCTCMVALTSAHQEQVDARLRESGLNPELLAAEYRYIALDAPSVLETFLNEGKLDRHRFHNDMNQLMRQAASGGRPLYVTGEMASMLAQRDVSLAVELEQLWNELSDHFSFTLFCPYLRAPFMEDEDGKALRRIYAVHGPMLRN
jgi:hypothetical protein